MRFLSALLLTLVCVLPMAPPTSADSLADSTVRIRVTARTPESARWTGSLVSIVRDTLTMHNDDSNGALVTVPTLHITSYEISRGRHRNVLQGAGLGLAAGALMGAGIGYSSYHPGDFLTSSAGESAVFGAVTLGVVGLALGTLVGTFTHSYRWRSVPLDELRDASRP